MSQKSGTCAYCGKVGPITSDHVPPKLLFGPTDRHNLITVPSCKECNGSFSKDDEYLRLVLSMRQDVEDSPSGTFLWEKSFRSLQHPKAAAMKTKVLKSVHQLILQDSDGSNEKRLAFETDFIRLKTSAQRIIQGLFYHHTKRSLAPGYIAFARFEELPKDSEFLHKQDILSQISLLDSSPLFEKGAGTIRYKLVRDKANADNTYWVIELLESLSFFGFTFKPTRQLKYPHGRPL